MKRTEANKLLDQSAEQLASRHQQRLELMTNRALKKAERQRTREHWLLSLPQPAYGWALLLVVGLAFSWMLNRELVEPPQTTVQLPSWILDEQVPMELLENPEFYQWFAKQQIRPQV